MIYNDKYIFVHVPKTGGMSVSSALGGKSKKISTHTPLRCVPKGDRFAFGFIRNPWARQVSLYRFLCQKNFRNTDNFDQEAIRKMGFKAWLMEDRFIMQEDDHPEGEPWVMKDHWRTSESGSLLPMQRRPQMWWLEGCDFIGKTDNLDRDFKTAMQVGNILHRELPHNNTTKGGEWQDEYDYETFEFICHYFEPDINFGGYTFEPT